MSRPTLPLAARKIRGPYYADTRRALAFAEARAEAEGMEFPEFVRRAVRHHAGYTDQPKQGTNMPKLLMTTQEAADYIGTTPATIRRLGVRGELVRVHEGSARHRYRGRDVEAYRVKRVANGGVL